MKIGDKKRKSVIFYLVRKLGNRLTRTKLIKFLFIIDYIAKNGKRKGIGRNITGTKYYYYRHGPFSREILRAISDMQGKEIVETDVGNPNEFASYYKYRIGNMPRFEPEITGEEKEIIDFVIKEYGNLPLNQLLEIVYSVPEMKEAQPLQIILD